MGVAVGSRVKVYTDTQKRETALTFALDGRISTTARKLKIPETTIKSWMGQDWWPAMLIDVRREKNDQLDAVYSRVIDAATEGTLERLSIGDPYTHKGELFYKPVAGQACMMIAAIAHDKRALMRGDPTSRTERVTTGKRLSTLQAEFRTASDVEVIAKT